MSTAKFYKSFNYLSFPFPNPPTPSGYSSTTQNYSGYSEDGDQVVYNLKGYGFIDEDKNGDFDYGTITSLSIKIDGYSLASFSGFEKKVNFDVQSGYLIDDQELTGITAEIAYMLQASDSITGSAYSDKLAGFSGDDKIIGNEGDDRLEGWSGNDSINGGQGADTVLGGAGNDVLDGGAGVDDWVLYATDSAAVQVNLSKAKDQATGTDGIDQLKNIEHVRGSDYGDTLTGNAGDNFLQGGKGSDTLDGGAGYDWADYKNASGAVTVNLSLRTNQATGADGTDQLKNIEHVRGSNSNDKLTGDSGDNYLRGMQGNDMLDGGTGYDWADYKNASGAVTVNLSLRTNQATGADGTDQLTNIEYVRGGDYGDRLTGNAGDNFLRGMKGNDTLDGRSGYDWADYWNATDAVTVNLSLATNQATGADGTDQLINIEHVRGSNYGDRLTGNAGDNFLRGMKGNDTLDGGAGNDWADYRNAAGAVTVNLSLATNQATGADGTDQLINIENIRGGDYNDLLKGSMGVNILTGRLGTDSLYGGVDKVKDIFDFNDITESTVGTTRDKVYDFVAKIDKIDLGGIDASTAKTGDQVFAFGGTAAKANSVWYKVADVDGNAAIKDLVIYGDVTGDAKADFEIGLVGVTAIAAADFVL